MKQNNIKTEARYCFVHCFGGFCHVLFPAPCFGGDWTARLIVFSATSVSTYQKYYAEEENQSLSCFHCICIYAFHGCFVSAYAGKTTAEIAIATSVLYLGARRSLAEWCH